MVSKKNGSLASRIINAIQMKQAEIDAAYDISLTGLIETAETVSDGVISREEAERAAGNKGLDCEHARPPGVHPCGF